MPVAVARAACARTELQQPFEIVTAARVDLRRFLRRHGELDLLIRAGERPRFLVNHDAATVEPDGGYRRRDKHGVQIVNDERYVARRQVRRVLERGRQDADAGKRRFLDHRRRHLLQRPCVAVGAERRPVQRVLESVNPARQVGRDHQQLGSIFVRVADAPSLAPVGRRARRLGKV